MASAPNESIVDEGTDSPADELRTAVETVLAGDPTELDGPGLVGLLGATRRALTGIQAVQEAVIAELAVPGKCGDPSKLAASAVEH